MRSPQSEAVYDEALAAWQEAELDRSVGRPPSGDRPLGSSDRAQAVRARRQWSAMQWEKAIPLLQQLRRAVEMNNGPAITRMAGALVKATHITFRDLHIVHVRPNQDIAAILGSHDGRPILITIAKTAIEDHFLRRHLTAKEANLLIDRNIQAFGHIAAAKFERSDYRAVARADAIVLYIDLTLADIEASGEMMTDR